LRFRGPVRGRLSRAAFGSPGGPAGILSA
jgi:hypothetical protein